MQVKIPLVINNIPRNVSLFGILSPKSIDIIAVNMNAHEFAIGTAIDNSAPCNV